MSRIAIVSIVLTLAVEPYGSLLCVSFCHPEAAAASSCRHQSIASPVLTDDNCCTTVMHDSAFLKENLWRGVSTSDPQNAVVVRRYQLFPVTTRDHPDHQAAHRRSPDNRPLDISLRL